MNIWHKINKFDNPDIIIEEIEVIKETPKTITYINQNPCYHTDTMTNLKNSLYYQFFQNKKDAVDTIRKRINDKIKKLENKLTCIKDLLSQLNELYGEE